MEKICYGCKKMKPLNHYIENEKEYAKCNMCRVKLVNRKNICDICGIRAKYNLFKEINGIRCFKHKTIEMIDVKNKRCKKCNKKRPTYNYRGELTPIYCADCKDASMINVRNKMCESCNTKQPSYNYIGEKRGIFCNTCKKDGMIDVITKKCVECKLHIPLYGYSGNKSAEYCNNCKKIEMINIKSKKCINCNKKRPSYNFNGELTPIYCADCKLSEMIDIRSRKCEKCNIKTPNFNYKNETIAKFCGDCKDVNMINKTRNVCITCKKIRPHYNYKNTKKPEYCTSCKTEGMIDVTRKLCENCKLHIPVFNYKSESVAKFCSECKDTNMIDILHKKCKEISCKKNAYYANPGVLPQYCLLHKKDGMMKNPRKKCIGLETDECKEMATHGVNKPLHCEIHATDSEYNLTERTCSECNRIDVLNKNGICVNFCSFEEKDRLMKKSVKKHEEFIGKLLKEEIDLTCMYQDEVVDSTCSKKRPDFVYHCGTHIVIIEVDENQHKSYKCTAYGDTKEGKIKGENIRMYEIAQSFDGLPVIFIRYNPDELKDVDQHKVKISSSKRHLLLIKWIKTIFRMEWKQGIYVKYLFYDGFQEANVDFLSISENDVLTF